MEKTVFKNEYVNIVVGLILVIFALIGYFTKVIEDFLPIIFGIVLVLYSINRFLYTFKKIKGKNATLVLVIEFVLDLVFAGLLMYLGDHEELFIGLVIYTRGVSYLIINYVSNRKIEILQYLLNIIYITFGSFLIFTSYNSVLFLSILISVLMFLFGALYLNEGIKKYVAKSKKKEKKVKLQNDDNKDMTEIKDEVEEINDENIDSEEEVIEVDDKKVEEIDYNKKTMKELKDIAKKRKISGISQLNKSELIAKLKE